MSLQRLKIGFSVVWEAERERTWSHIPISLLRALMARTDVDTIDAPVVISPHIRKLARVAHLRWTSSGWASAWRMSGIWHNAMHRAYRMASDAAQADVDLLVGEHGVMTRPAIIYTDHTMLHLDHYVREHGRVPPGYYEYPASTIARQAQRQRTAFESAAALTFFSEWEASFVRRNGFPNNVYVIPPGTNAALGPIKQHLATGTQRRLLFVGRDFLRKGGATVVEACARLPHVTLVVCGPAVWPLPGPIPEYVEFRGDLPRREIGLELEKADALAMPSTFEAYGIAFIEALCMGLPVLGRNTCAMPEFIRDGVNGLLVRTGTVDECTGLLQQLLYQPDIAANAQAMAQSYRDYYSWERAAEDFVRVARHITRPGSPAPVLVPMP